MLENTNLPVGSSMPLERAAAHKPRARTRTRKKLSIPDRLRQQFGWVVDQHHGRHYVLLSHDMVGLAVPRIRANAAVDLLKRLDTYGPVLELNKGSPRWVFLADQNSLVLPQLALPPDVKLLGYSTPLPLPLRASSSARWIVEPDVRRRWLPSLAAVLAAVRAP